MSPDAIVPLAIAGWALSVLLSILVAVAHVLLRRAWAREDSYHEMLARARRQP